MLVQPSFRPLAAPEKLWGSSVKELDTLQANPRRMAVDLLRLFLAHRTPITLWGPVGARKTRTIEGLRTEVDENGVPYQVITIQPSTEDPTVIHGIMYTSKGADGETIMRRAVPDVAQQIVRYWEDDDRHGLTILFLDEMTTCMPAQQHALLGLLTHGKYGDIDTSPYTAIAMAANPEGTVSTVNDLGEQVLNRGGHIAWYGDVQLFLEEWRTGFGNPSRQPDERVEWYVSELLLQAPDAAFRNPTNWSPDTLVPYLQMEHTERAVTEMAGMVELVNEVFASSPDHIRYAYIVETTRALLGNEWAGRMAHVTAMEGERLSAGNVTRRVREQGVTIATPHVTLLEGVGGALHTLPSGTPLRQDQAESLAGSLVDRVRLREGGLSLDTYVAAWAFVVTAASSGQQMSLHSHMVRLLELGGELVTSGVVERSQAVPAFVPQEMRATLRTILAAANTERVAS